MAQISYQHGYTMKFPLWLVFDRDGTVKLYRKSPVLGRDERAMYLDVSLPLSLWNQPSLRANITVEQTDPDAAVLLDLEAAGAALKGALGVDIDLQIIPAESSAERKD